MILVEQGVYQHYKGGYYFVYGVTTLHDEDRQIVIYYSNQYQEMRLRYLDDFNAVVEWPDGVRRTRFVPVEIREDR
jgi:hypothetical protein